MGRGPRRPPGRTVVDLSVAGVADQGETLDVGVSALVPVGDMVHRTQTRRRRTPRPGATPVRGDQGEPLIGAGQTTPPPQVQWTTRMVEQREHRMRLLGQRQCVRDGEHPTCGCRGQAPDRLLQLLECHRDDHCGR